MRTQEQIRYEQRAKRLTLQTLHRTQKGDHKWFNTPIEPKSNVVLPDRAPVINRLETRRLLPR